MGNMINIDVLHRKCSQTCVKCRLWPICHVFVCKLTPTPLPQQKPEPKKRFTCIKAFFFSDDWTHTPFLCPFSLASYPATCQSLSPFFTLHQNLCPLLLLTVFSPSHPPFLLYFYPTPSLLTISLYSSPCRVQRGKRERWTENWQQDSSKDKREEAHPVCRSDQKNSINFALWKEK